MNKLVSVQFRKDGKIYFFDSGNLVLKKGDNVIVETELGLAYGEVCENPIRCNGNLSKLSLKKVIRLATEKDRDRYEKNRRMERDVYEYCLQRVQDRSLPMNLVSAERFFDGSKIVVYFTAEGRVDFRELVKDLVQRFHTRIEMRQIGVRHQAKMVGGLGSCGRQLCCTSFLNNFEPVSIKMAKEQSLSLNPSKISGMCGRLMCCLNYEHAYYEEAKKDLPKLGRRVKTNRGEGKVIRQNIFRETLTVSLESGEEVEIPYDEIINDAN
ncbi:MAG: stage 0 sporulation family protein [Deltaproteobacteria bacterium]|nr:stage 0 sporulation family protein [Deltaproteobacteria bacterium]MBW2137611.1 stage 0 sporulation family protein [Deltaproteobacteria bacterium]